MRDELGAAAREWPLLTVDLTDEAAAAELASRTPVLGTTGCGPCCPTPGPWRTNGWRVPGGLGAPGAGAARYVLTPMAAVGEPLAERLRARGFTVIAERIGADG